MRDVPDARSGEPGAGRPPPPRSEDEAKGPEKVNVLIIDDRPQNLVTLSAILEQPDLNLVRARSGKDALRCLLRQEFAAILLDVNMPEMDGFETAALIRQRQSSAHTPIIFVTAYGDEAQLYKAYALGAVDYILTPVQPDVLKTKVAVFVDLFRKSLEIQRQAEILRELEAHEHRRQLSETNERLELALEAGRMGAWEWDLSEQLMTWSPTLEAIFGLAPGQFSGRADDLRMRLHPDDRDRVIADMMAAAQHGREFCIEHRIIRSNSEIAWVEVRGRVFSEQDGTPRRLAGVCMDISERKRAQDELAAHRDRLEELVTARTEELRTSHERLRRSDRLASLGTLAAGIAHEINNPLNAILLATQYAIETESEWSNEELRGTLGDIIKEARRCAAIVKNVLLFAREERTPKALHPLNDIMHRAASLARTYIEAPHLELSAEADGQLPRVMLNPTQIEQVLINLIQNAAQAADGPVSVRLKTGLVAGLPLGDCVQLTVSDNGPGIPPEKLAYIFDPFYSTRQTRGGTGLGLSIAHGIITDHGGSIDVRSECGQGTTFILQFPVPTQEDLDDPQPAAASVRA